MPLKIVNLILAPFICIFFLFSQFLLAASITQLKGNKVLIDNDEDEVQVGQEFYVVDKNNKKKLAVLLKSLLFVAKNLSL